MASDHRVMGLDMRKYFKLPNPGLRAFLANNVVGQPDEYRTSFFQGMTLQGILDGWQPYLESIAEEWPSLLEFENDLRKKVGPMSVRKPLAERLNDIESYYDSILLESEPLSSEAIVAALKEMSSISGLRMRSQKSTVENMKLSTNSGSPYFTKRRVVIDDTLPASSWQVGSTTLSIFNGQPWESCAVLGWRGQEGGESKEDVKQRVIWMFPFGINVQEQQVYQPLVAACQAHELIPAWVSMECVDREITRMFDTKSSSDLVVCTDFSKFDQHFNADMQHTAKCMLRGLFLDGAEVEDWLEDVFPIKYNIPLCTDWGNFYYGAHGMASGSGGTNADETLTHRVLQHEAAISKGSRLNPHSQCLGDDGVLTYPGITVDDVVRTYTAHGQEMNPDKQYASEHDCVYLRRWHHDRYRSSGICVGVYSTYRALGRLAEQERYYSPEVWSKEMVALRQLSILENCKWHPLREQFVDYCMKGDKYRLGLDIPGFFDGIARYAAEAASYMPDFLGYSRSLGQDDPAAGISEWWVVQYLRSKA